MSVSQLAVREMPENRLNFVYELEGDIRELDVFRLAPTLLALGALLQESNRRLNPGSEIGVNAKPFREGSFIVDLTVFSGTNWQQLVEFFKPHSVEQLKTLLETIGILSTGIGTVTMGAVQAIKYLGRRPEKVEEVGPSEFRYTTQDKSITVKAPVHTLLSDSTIVQNIYQIYGPPIEGSQQIKDVKTFIEGDESTAVVVSRDEAGIIREFAGSGGANPEAEAEKEHISFGVYLNPKRGSFGDDPKDWSFWRGDEVITATIKDRSFLAQYARGEIRLNESDLLTVDLLERQRIQGTKVLKPIYEIIRVVDYKKGAEQQRLPMS
jgi:hypothetical protein